MISRLLRAEASHAIIVIYFTVFIFFSLESLHFCALRCFLRRSRLNRLFSLSIMCLKMTSIPEAARERLLTLVHFLEKWEEERITSKAIGAALGCKDSLIRADIRHIGCAAGVSNGYDAQALKAAAEYALGLHERQTVRKCCIVGLGRLGAALLDSSFFAAAGFELAAGFDSNVNRTEILHSTFPLYPATRIESVLPAAQIAYAVLTAPAKEAAMMTERLVRAEVRGIVNLTECVLRVPPDVKVENASLPWALQKIV